MSEVYVHQYGQETAKKTPYLQKLRDVVCVTMAVKLISTRTTPPSVAAAPMIAYVLGSMFQASSR